MEAKGYRDGCASCASLRAEVAREKARPRWIIGLSDESAGRFAGAVTLASLACAACGEQRASSASARRPCRGA